MLVPTSIIHRFIIHVLVQGGSKRSLSISMGPQGCHTDRNFLSKHPCVLFQIFDIFAFKCSAPQVGRIACKWNFIPFAHSMIAVSPSWQMFAQSLQLKWSEALHSALSARSSLAIEQPD